MIRRVVLALYVIAIVSCVREVVLNVDASDGGPVAPDAAYFDAPASDAPP
jgi:hypothetical protein